MVRLTRREIILRPEEPSDHRIVEELTREAFWNSHVPGCNEHYLASVLRVSDSFIKQLDIVALLNNKIVGNIMYTLAKISLDGGGEKQAVSFGPVSILPEFQRQGIGTLLIGHTSKIAARLGYGAILIYGDPAYYSRLGFVPAERYGIGTADDMYAAPLQAFELVKGALSNCSGRFIEDEAYRVDEAAAKEFDKNFPYKEKLSGLPSQRRFQTLLGMSRPRREEG